MSWNRSYPHHSFTYYPSKSLIVSWNSVVHCFLTLNACSRHENTAMAQAPKLEANPNPPRGRASPLHSAGERQAWGTHPRQPGAGRHQAARGQGIICAERTICWTQIQSSSCLNPSGIALLSRATVAHLEFKSVLWNLNHQNTHHHKNPLWVLLTKQKELLPRAEK